MSPNKSLNAIGCGRVGTTLAALLLLLLLLQRHGVCEVQDLYSTTSTASAAEAKAV